MQVPDSHMPMPEFRSALASAQSISFVATPRQNFHPLFSPSGKWLYFHLDHKNFYRVPGPTQGWRKVTPQKSDQFRRVRHFFEDPHISPDGRKLIYSRRRTNGDIWIMTINES
jgi:Tol biopolymer transport system component